jgi:hypothetical protein
VTVRDVRQIQMQLGRYVWDTPSPALHSFVFQSALADPVAGSVNGWQLFDIRTELARMVRPLCCVVAARALRRLS